MLSLSKHLPTKKVVFCFAAFSLLIIGCNVSNTEHKSDKVKINNKMGKNVICVLGYNYPNLGFDFTSKEALLNKSALLTVGVGETKEIDTLGFCNKEVWDKYIKHSMIQVMVFDKDKLPNAAKLDDALLRRYYFTYVQLMKTNGVITIDTTRTNNYE